MTVAGPRLTRRRAPTALHLAAGPTAVGSLALVVAGVLAVVDVGGALADVLGLVTVTVALIAFCWAAFRLAEGPATRRDRQGGGRLP